MGAVDVYEKLGVFYLGRPVDPATGKSERVPLLYDSKDLTTHAVCVGMTGSGKTGLCISLLEEAAIDGIPALVIDPKGDLTNLLLSFPELRPEDFRPWIREDDARRESVSPDDWAMLQAQTWKQGLAEWDQDGARIRRLRAAAELAIYTPGSEAGLPVSILASFGAPPPAIASDDELLAERVGATVASLLGLLGIDADPIRSREHILLSNLLHTAWREGRDLDLAGLIAAIQKPPLERVGVMPLETFFPAGDRFALAMALNNLLAAPGFQSWLRGEPLDVNRLLYTAEGRPRIAIFSIAHLSDAERMFFVSLLLNQALGWMRGLSGTASLRAILYMDEIFGYLPPSANPPSKKPMLTLLKQARAVGFGMVLATQNPVDLDYKALSNIGTWFLGRLQTERDKLRVLEGLEGVTTGGGFDRARLDKLLSSLGKRVFLLHNVHESEPVLFQTRWAMSYLAGPLTRSQIQQLTVGRRAPVTSRAVAAAPAAGVGAGRPLLPPEVPQRFLPVVGRLGSGLLYEPHLLGFAQLSYADAKRGLDHREAVALLLPLGDGTDLVWDDARELSLSPSDLETEPASPEARFAPVPDVAAKAKSYPGWQKACADTLVRIRRLELFECPALKLSSKPGESERDFRIRLAETAREERDQATAELRQRWASKLETQERRVGRAAQTIEKEKSQASEAKLQTVLSVGQSLLGAFFGRKTFSATNLGRVKSAARGIGRGMKEGQDVDRAEDSLEVEQQRLEQLKTDLEAEITALGERYEPQSIEVVSAALKPKKSDVSVGLVTLAWAPYRQGDGGVLEPAWE